MPLIGKKAPPIAAKAIQGKKVINNFSLDKYLGEKYVILYFYPLDFTFVCPTELHAFQKEYEKFQEKNTEIVACSIDSHFSHLAWLDIPKSKGGIEGICYPIIADVKKEVARDFDVLFEEEGIAYRGLFLIDKKGIIRHQIVNDLPLGRSIEEALRMVDALAFFEKNGEVCPANWNEGKKSMKPSQEGLKEFFAYS